jgi:crotonobetainyl-CoA:carnitine CoA-transferase CaiB-like acyl-CoA transferase
LAGIRILDLTSVVMGPLATQTLGDLGADVIMVESARGDTNRSMGTGPVRQLSDISLNLLRNKRNVALDLKDGDGRAALLRIAQTCDVFVTNLRPAPLARLRLTYADVAAVRPDVIFCQAQGFPSDSPDANDPAYDDTIQAACGAADAVRRASGEPALMPTLLADKVGGLVLTQAILAALFHRARSGEGQHVELSMTDALSSFLLVEHGAGAITQPRRQETGYQRILTPHRRPQRTSDGSIVVFPYLESHWRALLSARDGSLDVAAERLGREGRRQDPGYAYEALAKIIVGKTTAEWLALCQEHQIPAVVPADLDDLVQRLPERVHPVAGAFKIIPPPVRFSATPASIRRAAPLIGQHNRSVLREVGLSDEEISRLEDRGVLRTSGSVDTVASDRKNPQ